MKPNVPVLKAVGNSLHAEGGLFHPGIRQELVDNVAVVNRINLGTSQGRTLGEYVGLAGVDQLPVELQFRSTKVFQEQHIHTADIEYPRLSVEAHRLNVMVVLLFRLLYRFAVDKQYILG